MEVLFILTVQGTVITTIAAVNFNEHTSEAYVFIQEKFCVDFISGSGGNDNELGDVDVKLKAPSFPMLPTESSNPLGPSATESSEALHPHDTRNTPQK
jgi:hypothetical protein